MVDKKGPHHMNLNEKQTNGNSDVIALFRKGNSYIGKGALAEAQECFSRILEIDPGNYNAVHMLAIIACAAGLFDVAVELAEESIAICDTDPNLYHTLGDACKALELPGKALAAYRKAYELDDSNLEVIVSLVTLMSAVGEAVDAEKILKTALKRQPDDASLHNALGLALMQQEKLDDANEHFMASISMAPDRPEYYCNFAETFMRRRQWDKAQEIFETAVAIDNNYCPAYLGLGELYLETGNKEGALSCWQRVVAIDPKQPGPFYRYVDGDYGIDVEDYVIQVKAWLDDENYGLCRDRRTIFYYALGRYEQKKGNYDAAWEYFEKGSELVGARYDRKFMEDVTSDIEKYLTTEFFESRSTFGNKDVVPIFIVGMPRSGTTLVESILSSHSKVDTVGESNLISLLSAALPKQVKEDVHSPQAMTKMTIEQSRLFANLYSDRIRQLGAEGKYIIDKAPGNYAYIGMIKVMFPNAKVIYCKRNPLDVAVSNFTIRYIAGLDWSYDLNDFVHAYKMHERIMAHWDKVLPGFVNTIQYEELIENQEPLSKEMLSFCGLAWEDECMEFHKSNRVVRTASLNQVKKPIYKSSRQRWKKYEKHLGPVIEAFPEWVDY